jgi:hypothetical protein
LGEQCRSLSFSLCSSVFFYTLNKSKIFWKFRVLDPYHDSDLTLYCSTCTNHHLTGRFLMFCVITNIYNNNNCSEPQGNWKSFFFLFFLTTRDVRCVHHGWHGTHRYDIQALTTHASTWANMFSTYTRIA